MSQHIHHLETLQLSSRWSIMHGSIDLKSPPPETVKGELHGISAVSTKIMENFLKDGAINPALNQTQKGFYSVFASWILEDNLLFTTGETSGIKRLFKYLILDANDSNDDDSNNGLFQVVEPKDGEEVLEKSSALKKVHTLGLFFLLFVWLTYYIITSYCH